MKVIITCTKDKTRGGKEERERERRGRELREKKKTRGVEKAIENEIINVTKRRKGIKLNEEGKREREKERAKEYTRVKAERWKKQKMQQKEKQKTQTWDKISAEL